MERNREDEWEEADEARGERRETGKGEEGGVRGTTAGDRGGWLERDGGTTSEDEKSTSGEKADSDEEEEREADGS